MSDINKFDTNDEIEIYKKDLAKALLAELMLIMHGQEKVHGRDFADSLAGTYLSSFISTLVYNAMIVHHENGPITEENKSAARADYHALRQLIEDAVTTGIETGITAANPTVHPDVSCSIEWLSHVENGTLLVNTKPKPPRKP